MVRLEIFQRISKKIHELFGLTEKAANGSVRKQATPEYKLSPGVL